MIITAVLVVVAALPAVVIAILPQWLLLLLLTDVVPGLLFWLLPCGFIAIACRARFPLHFAQVTNWEREPQGERRRKSTLNSQKEDQIGHKQTYYSILSGDALKMANYFAVVIVHFCCCSFTCSCYCLPYQACLSPAIMWFCWSCQRFSSCLLLAPLLPSFSSCLPLVLFNFS